MARTQRPRIGLIVYGVTYSYQEQILLGADEECRARDVDLVCVAGGNLRGEQANDQTYDLLAEDTFDGVLLVTATLGGAVGTPAFEQLLARFGKTPMCSIGHPLPNAINVVVEGETSVEELTRHLVDVHQRRSIAFIQGNSAESDLRLAAYKRALQSRGIQHDESLIFPGNYHGDAGAAAVEHLVQGGKCRADGIVAANDWMAFGAISALDKRGIQVPTDVAVVGFDDVEKARFEMPSLTTVRQPIKELGVHGVRALLSQLGGQPSESTIRLSTRVQLRKSCGCYGGAQLRYSLRAPPVEPVPGSNSAASLSRTRNKRAQAISAAAPNFGQMLSVDWSTKLAEALDDDLADPEGHRLEQTLEAFITKTLGLGNVAAWHHAVSALRKEAEATIADPERLRRTSELFDAAQVLVSAHAERVQGKRRIAKEILLQALTQLGGALRAASTYEDIAQVLRQQLPGLGVPGACVVAHAGKLTPQTHVRVAFAYDEKRGLLPEVDGMRAGELIPGKAAFQRRGTWLLGVASFRDELLGFVTLELSDIEMPRYDSIREQIGIALNAARLLRTVVEEVTRRERAERARLETEMALAHRIQAGILPRRHQVTGLDIGSVMHPASEVGGDYYDVLPVAGGAWLAIGDVAGHGLPTGLVMLMIQSSVASLTSVGPNAAPSEVWRHLNSVLFENVRVRLDQDEHATLTLLRYDGGGNFTFAGAHEDIIVYRKSKNDVELIPTPGVWAGISNTLPEGATEDNRLRLEVGDLMLLYTDGITEATNQQGEVFGIERLCETLMQAEAQGVNAIAMDLVSAAQDWACEQEDDYTLIVVRYAGERGES